jgi:hypothetical protein
VSKQRGTRAHPGRMGAERVLRAALIGIGAAALGWGAYLVLFGLPPRVWLPIAIWLAAGSVVHDLLIAPLSLLLGRSLTRLGRPTGLRIAGNALRGAWLGIGTVLLVGLPLLIGAGRRANPTVIPGRPGLNLALSLALVIIGAGVVIAFNRLRAGRRAHPDPAHPDPAHPASKSP